MYYRWLIHGLVGQVRKLIHFGFFLFDQHHHMLISNNTHIKKNYFYSNMIQKGNVTLLQHFPKDYFAVDVDRSKCLYMSLNTLFCTHYVGNMIYHKFSNGDVSYRFNGGSFNVMSEFTIFMNKLLMQLTQWHLKSSKGWKITLAVTTIAHSILIPNSYKIFAYTVFVKLSK